VKLALSSVDITASVGVATMARDADADRLIAAADAALYSAKHRGRNRVEIAVVAPESTDGCRRRSTLPSPSPSPAAALAAAR
jgi:predicted signal transduction protein with EAL and GGDEF domain